MKKAIPFLLVFLLLLSMTACAGKEARGTEGSSEETTLGHTEGTTEAKGTTAPNATEETTVGTTETAETEPVETEPEPTQSAAENKPQNNNSTSNQPHTHRYTVGKTQKETCTKDEIVTYVCDCGHSYTQRKAGGGQHTWGSWFVSTKPTHTAKGEEKRYCERCIATETRELPPVKERMYAGWEIIEKNIVNPYICRNGEELQTRMFGENNCFKVGDSITVRIKMSDGSYATEADFKNYFKNTKFDARGCTYSMSGELIHITFNKDFTNSQGWFGFIVKNSDGTEKKDAIIVRLVETDDLAGNSVYIKYQFEEYGELKGLKHIHDGYTFFTEYSTGYTWEDASLSITGCTIQGTDDTVYFEGNPDWIDDMLDLIDTYCSMDFNVWSLTEYPTCFATLAGYSDKI